MTRTTFALIAIAACISLASSATPRQLGPANTLPFPKIMLWAWERPDDLRSISPSEAGVAYLAGTIYAQETHFTADTNADTVRYRPRLQPLHLSAGVTRLPVIRIETTTRGLVTSEKAVSTSPVTDAQIRRINDILTRVASSTTPPSLQIDFDATSSERPSYAQILTALRARLGPSARISITALASWCSGDAWLATLPSGTIDEAVPMLFRMGTDATQIAATLANDGEFRAPVCRTSAGISDDETFSRQILNGHFAAQQPSWKQKRIYIFHSGTWTQKSALMDLGELEKWHAAFSPSR